jgi:FkbM family methyltransferase
LSPDVKTGLKAPPMSLFFQHLIIALSRIFLFFLPRNHPIFRFSYYAYKNLWEDPHQWLFRHGHIVLKEGVVFDIGAGIGHSSEIFLKHSNSSVHAFEPEENNFCLLKTIQKKFPERFFPYPLAVGRASFPGELLVDGNHSFDHRLRTSTGPSMAENSRHPVVDVTVIALDDFIVQHGIDENVVLIKIDVQGAEIDVIEGAKTILKQQQKNYLSVEYSADHWDSYGRSWKDLQFLIDDYHYSVFLVNRRHGLWHVEPISLPELEKNHRHNYVTLLFESPHP